MTDFSTIPIRINDIAVKAAWFNTIRTKLIESTTAPSITEYVDDAAFVTAKGSAAETSNYYYNTTINSVKVYDGTVWREIADTSKVQTFINKIIDGNNNTLTVLAPTQLSGATPIANGGSGQTTQQTAINAISDVSSATNEYVLTKDTSTGDAIFKQAIASSFNLSIATKTTTYTLTSSDDMILCDSSGGAFTLTLPAAALNTGKVFYFKKIGSDLNTISIDGNGIEEIDGVTSTLISTEHEMLEIVSDSANWQILSRKIDGSQKTFTPIGSWTTNTVYNGFYTRVGSFAHITYGLQLVGAPNAATLTFDMPSGLVIDNTVFNYGVAGSEQPIFDSKGGIFDSGSGYSSIQAHYFNTTKFQVWTTADRGAAGNNNTKLTQAAPVTFANLDRIYVHIKVPIVGWKGN